MKKLDAVIEDRYRKAMQLYMSDPTMCYKRAADRYGLSWSSLRRYVLKNGGKSRNVGQYVKGQSGYKGHRSKRDQKYFQLSDDLPGSY